jgi:hypothetical protein
MSRHIVHILGRQHIVSRHRTTDALEVQLPHGFDGDGFIDSQQMILRALDKLGGEDYLVTLGVENSSAFSSLLGKVLPTTLVPDSAGGERTVSHLLRSSPLMLYHFRAISSHFASCEGNDRLAQALMATPKLKRFFWFTFHEVGHAAFDMFNVPIFGHEEDAADKALAELQRDECCKLMIAQTRAQIFDHDTAHRHEFSLTRRHARCPGHRISSAF